MDSAHKARTRWRHIGIISALVMLFVASPVWAQYFGRNKVQYKKLDFQVLRTEHFDIYFYPSAREGIDIAARMAERWWARLSRQLGHDLRGRQPLVLYGSHVDFEQTNIIPGEVGEGTGGVTEPLRRRIVLPLAGPLTDTDHVIGHELVHAYQFDITTLPGAGPGETGANTLPLWFIEGMAEYLSIGPVDPHTAMWLRDAAREEKLPTIDKLNDPRYFPYRWGQAFWAFVGGTYGDGVIGRMLAIAGAAGSPEVAFKQVLGVSSDELSAAWHAAIRATYGPVLENTTAPDQVGTVILEDSGGISGLNVGPALSPDGRLIAYLSQRDLLSIDLYVAETATGKVLHKLTSSATDPHLSSLQFIYSSGTWDAESRRLALATINKGRAALVIFDAAEGRRERDIIAEGVDEVLNPSWSPDGGSIVFSGMRRGLTDLFIVDLASGAVRALTDDPYTDLQPAWAPDGRRIAFVTDRFSTRLANLEIGNYRLAVIDVGTRQVAPVPAVAEGKHINPQWAPDSSALFFISDRDGISNVYRSTLAGELTQLTTVATGVTGITAQSPALSIASRSGDAAFSVYDKGRYRIHTLPPSSRALPSEGNRPARATLPPVARPPSEVAALLSNPEFGLPPASAAYPVSEYRGGLQLDAIGQPSIAFGADRFGAAIGGGLSFFFSDLLGNHNLSAAANVSQGLGNSFALGNTSAQLAYINQSRRWNWGLVGGQVPFLSGGFQSGLASVGGESAVVEQTVILRQTERSAGGLLAYPFSRASRIEFQGNVSQLSFDQIVETQAFSLNTGGLLFNDRDTRRIGDRLTFGTASAALVYDTSVFGATSPVAGSRYRLEAAPTWGAFNYTSVLADYRRYFMPVSFYTFAVRGLHYARYGSGGDDPRLTPLFLGYPTLLRGYDVYSFDASDCQATATSDCPAFDRLIGSRVLVANLEFRFPLLRPFGVSQAMYGPVPLEFALFADGGVAWNQGQSPSFLGGDRRGVSSVGIALRANLLGFALGEFDFTRPLQRESRGWVFQFNLAPGF